MGSRDYASDDKCNNFEVYTFLLLLESVGRISICYYSNGQLVEMDKRTKDKSLDRG